jgi:hypothetical protein
MGTPALASTWQRNALLDHPATQIGIDQPLLHRYDGLAKCLIDQFRLPASSG